MSPESRRRKRKTPAIHAVAINSEMNSLKDRSLKAAYNPMNVPRKMERKVKVVILVSCSYRFPKIIHVLCLPISKGNYISFA